MSALDQHQGSSEDPPVYVIQNQGEGSSGRQYSQDIQSHGSSSNTGGSDSTSFNQLEQERHYNYTSFTSNSSNSVLDYYSQQGSGIGYGPTLVNNNNNIGAPIQVVGAEQQDRNWIVVGVLIGLIVFLWVILGGMICYPLFRFIQRRMPVSKRRIDRRYDTIEGWLITKVVRQHDQGCERIQKKYSKQLQQQQQQQLLSEQDASTVESEHDASSPLEALATATSAYNNDSNNVSEDENVAATLDIESQTTTRSSIMTTTVSSAVTFIKHTESSTTAATYRSEESVSSCGGADSLNQDELDNEHDAAAAAAADLNSCRECPICMETFSVNDVVSWSSYETCTHVYHHQCIKEWLLRHNNCPFCREIFLPVDKYHKKITIKVFKELSDLRARRAERTFFCIQDGLVTLLDQPQPPPSSSSSFLATTNVNGTTTSQPFFLRNTCRHITKQGRDHRCESSSSSSHLRGGYHYQLFKDKLKPGITKAELKKLRGDRFEKVIDNGTPIMNTEIPYAGDRDFILNNINEDVLGRGSQSAIPNYDGVNHNINIGSSLAGTSVASSSDGEAFETHDITDDSDTSDADSIYTSDREHVEIDEEIGAVVDEAVTGSSDESSDGEVYETPKTGTIDVSESSDCDSVYTSDRGHVEVDVEKGEVDNDDQLPPETRELPELSPIEIDEIASSTSTSQGASEQVARRSRPKRLISF